MPATRSGQLPRALRIAIRPWRCYVALRSYVCHHPRARGSRPFDEPSQRDVDAPRRPDVADRRDARREDLAAAAPADRTAFVAGVSSRRTASGSGEVPSRQICEWAFMRPGVIVRPVERPDSSAPSGAAMSPPIARIRPPAMRTSARSARTPRPSTTRALRRSSERRSLRRAHERALRVVVDPVPVELDAETRTLRQVLVALLVDRERAALQRPCRRRDGRSRPSGRSSSTATRGGSRTRAAAARRRGPPGRSPAGRPCRPPCACR